MKFYDGFDDAEIPPTIKLLVYDPRSYEPPK